MKALLHAALLFCSVACGAATNDQEALAFPKTTFVIEGPQGTSAKGHVRDNRAPIGGASSTRFSYQGAVSRSEAEKSLGELSWRHVAKTEAGDVYLIVFMRPDGERTAMALLFDGRSDASCGQGNWRVTFMNEKA